MRHILAVHKMICKRKHTVQYISVKQITLLKYILIIT